MLAEGGLPKRGEIVLQCHTCQYDLYLYWGRYEPRDAYLRRIADTLHRAARVARAKQRNGQRPK